jgi:hypothetical protein
LPHADGSRGVDYARKALAGAINAMGHTDREVEDMRATLDKSAKLALLAVHAERANLYDADYLLKTVAAAIGEHG